MSTPRWLLLACVTPALMLACHTTEGENERRPNEAHVQSCPELGPEGGSIATASECQYTPGPSGQPFAATVEWAMTHGMSDPTTGAPVPAYTFDELSDFVAVFQAPVIGQATDDNGDGLIDNDDTPDIAVVMANVAEDTIGALRLISGDGSAVHASVRLQSFSNANGTHSYGPHHYAGVAMGDIDGDGAIEVVTMVSRDDNGQCWPAAYEVVQSGSTVRLELDKVYGGGDYYCGAHAPALADIDGDGTVDVIFGKNALRGSDFSLMFSASGGRGWYSDVYYPQDGYWNSGYHSFAYDLDGDGAQMEVVAGRSVYQSDGELYCELGEYVGSAWVPALDGYPAVADLLRFSGDSAGEPEIVLTGNEYISVYHGVPDYDPHGLARCLLIDALPNDPRLDPDVSGDMPDHPDCDTTRSSFGGQPTISDFDGDGDQEIAVAGACWYSVFHFDEDNRHRFERFAMAQTHDWSSASTGSTVFDFNGDGEYEVVFSDEMALYVWSIDSRLDRLPWQRLRLVLVDANHKSWTIHEYPLVSDVDGDGKAEIVVVNSHLPGYEDHYGIYVLGAADDDWVSARKLWNQHAYYVTNVQDDGGIGYGGPNYSPYHADDLNGFRQQRPGDFGATAAPNLLVQAEPPCQDDCGAIDVWVSVSNEGEFITVDAGTEVVLYGVAAGLRTELARLAAPSPVHPGERLDALHFGVQDWAAYEHLVAVVDDPSLAGSWGWGTSKECDETDNEVIISLEGLCE